MHISFSPVISLLFCIVWISVRTKLKWIDFLSEEKSTYIFTVYSRKQTTTVALYCSAIHVHCHRICLFSRQMEIKLNTEYSAISNNWMAGAHRIFVTQLQNTQIRSIRTTLYKQFPDWVCKMLDRLVKRENEWWMNGLFISARHYTSKVNQKCPNSVSKQYSVSFALTFTINIIHFSRFLTISCDLWRERER